MRQTTFAAMHCSIARSLEVFGDWWSPLIVRDLYLGIDRFDALVADLGLSRNVLADRLETLTAGGVVNRVAYQDHPPRHRYVLTDAGHDLVPILMAVTAWGDKWASPAGAAPMLFRHEGCGHRFTPDVCCSECGQLIDAASVTVEPGPGGRTAPGTMLIAQALGVAGYLDTGASRPR